MSTFLPAHLPLVVCLLGSATQSDGTWTYRTAFERGVAASERGDATDAASWFRRAGLRAPQAPLWRAYLARAEGREEVVPRSGTSEPWHPAPLSGSRARWSPSGERMLQGDDPASLWDVRTGECLAVLESSYGGMRSTWRFDRSGLWIVHSSDDQGPVELRSARTGEPVALESRLEARVDAYTRLEWSQNGRAGIVPGFGETLEVPLDGGILRIWNPPQGFAPTCALDTRGERVLAHRGNNAATLELFDASSGTLLGELQRGCEVVGFSPDERWALGVGPRRVVVLDTETGKRLSGPDVPDDGEVRSRTFAMRGSRLFLIDSNGGLLVWDLVSDGVVQKLQLERASVSESEPLFRWLGAGPAWILGNRLLVQDLMSVHAYELERGREVWSAQLPWFSIQEVLSNDGTEILVEREGCLVRVAVDTGERLPVQFVVAEVRASSLVLDAAAALVGCDDGSLRRVDLEGGSTLGMVQAMTSAGGMKLERLADSVAAWREGRRLSVHRTPGLERVGSVPLTDGERVIALSDDGSMAVVWAWEGHPRLVRVRSGESTGLPAPDIRLGGAAFSPDGSLVVLVDQQRLELFDVASGEWLARWPLTHVGLVDRVAWLGADRLVVGWGTRERDAGVDVYSFPGGELERTLAYDGFMFGGNVSDLWVAPGADRVTFTLRSTGVATSFAAPDWTQDWAFDFGGGNGGFLALRGAPSSRRLCVSGMTDSHAVVLDRDSGEVLARHEVHGSFDLSGSSDDRYVAGTRGGRLVVLTGQEFSPHYVRGEGLGGGARVQRGDSLSLRQGLAGEWPGGFLGREGRSLPLDCWEAWLNDPWGLRSAALDELPEPPAIVDGSARVIDCDDSRANLELVVDSSSEVLGLEVRVVGHGESFTPRSSEGTAVRFRLRTSLDGPWPRDVSLRAVARNGTRSAPLLVQVR